MRLPLALAGWDREQQTLKLPLFKKFRERPDMPFCTFKAVLQVPTPSNCFPAMSLHHLEAGGGPVFMPRELDACAVRLPQEHTLNL